MLLGLQALTYAVAGRWLMMLVSAAQLAYLLHKAQRGGSSLHAADMISVLPQEKRTRIWRLALCGALLILIVIRHAGALRTRFCSSLTLCRKRQVGRGRNQAGHAAAGGARQYGEHAP